MCPPAGTGTLRRRSSGAAVAGPDAVGDGERTLKRVTRRSLLAGGAAALAALATAEYGRFLAGDEFEEFVAEKLGVDVEVARGLLERAREREGEGYDFRAALFAFALQEPLALTLPDRLQEPAVRPFVEAMLDTPAGQRAFATDLPTTTNACAGLAPA